MNINDFKHSETCSECGGPAFSDLILAEKKDACYYKVKASAKVWPSAYASGRLVQCRKKGASNYGNKSESVAEAQLDENCWDTHKQVGMKNKGGRQVPNCVPKESVAEAAKGIPHKVRYSYDDPSGNGTASGHITLHAPNKESAARYARSDLTKRGKKNVRVHAVTPQTKSVAESQLNEYLVRAGMPVKDVLALNLFQDTGPDGQEGMADDPRWNRLMKRYQPIANMLAKKIMALGKNRRLSDAEAEAVEEVWYDGSDAYEDMEVEYLADYYNMQIETVEAIIAGELQDEIDEGSTEFAGDTEQDQELRNYAQDTADRAREQIKHKMFNMMPPEPDKDDTVHEEDNMNPEYDDEAGMAQGSLHTLQNAVAGLQDVIDSGDNLPEWCQEKISLAEDYLVTVWDYIQSEKAQGIDPEIEEMYHAMEQLAEEMARRNRVSVDRVWEQFEALPDNVLYETAAWRRKEGKSKTGGLNAKGVASYRRENPGSKLQTAVTTKPSKLKPGSKAAKRRKSFCARMSGVKGPMKKPNGKPTRKALALRKWNC